MADQFREDGYVLIREFFDAEAIGQFRDEADRMLEYIVNSSLANDRTSGRLDVVQDGDAQSVRAINPAVDLSRVFKRVATEDLPPLLRPLVDDTPISIDITAQLNYKQPLPEPIEALETSQADDRFPVHADWPYYEGWLPEDIVTGIVFVDACTEDNGPIEVWPGTHRRDIAHEETDLGLAVPPDELDHDAGERVLGPAGSVLLFDSRLVHSSEPNRTDEPRRLAIYGHAPESNVEVAIEDGSARPEAETRYPMELVESTYENEYQRLKRIGEYEDQFEAPG
jgi:ectoine hydroxylase-related dioxygenase (phytanoyl-CoA dioxygenase family)